MLSSLPKIIDKNFVVGFLLPALLAVVAATWAFPSVGVLNPVRSLADTQKLFGDLTYSALITLVLAIFLMTANDTQYKILEGYFPPVSWFLPLRWWHRLRFRWQQCEYKTIKSDWLTAIEKEEEFPERRRQRYEKLRSTLVFYYPTFDNEVMTTRFGNIIRSFEVYPREVHGADSVHVWSRLASVISKEFAGILDDARAQTDCFVNLTSLALLVALASLAAAAFTTDWYPTPGWRALTIENLGNLLAHAGPRHIASAGAGLAVVIIAYWRACVSAIAWGNLVRSAFDCFLPALINQLGYALPPTVPERKRFWTEFSVLIAFQEPMSPDWPIPSETTKTPVTGTEDGGKKIEEDDTSAARPGEPAAAPEKDKANTSNSMAEILASK